jgi:ribonuclease Z
LGRTVEMHIYCPAELQEIIEVQLKHSQSVLHYRIIYHPHQYINDQLIFEDEKVEVRTVVLNHRIPCSGFVFKEKELHVSISKYTIEKYKLDVAQIVAIRNGADLTLASGETIPNKKLVTRALPRSYAYCSDTCYDERIIEHIKGVDLLYHEATFMDDMKARAKETYHSTTFQAATIAKKAEVKQLMIGHYSARYKNLQPLLDEAKTIFENTILAVEGENTVLEQVKVSE